MDNGVKWIKSAAGRGLVVFFMVDLVCSQTACVCVGL